MHLFIEYDDDILWDYYDVTVMDVVREYEINQRKPKCRYIIEEALKNMLDDFVASSPRRGRARNRPDACYAAVVTDEGITVTSIPVPAPQPKITRQDGGDAGNGIRERA